MRIAHVSDLHLPVFVRGVLKSTLDIDREYELFETTVSKIVVLDVDILVITGDILEIPESLDTTDPLGQSPVLDIKNIISSYHKVHEIITASNVRYLIIPGNHDQEMTFWQVFDSNADSMEIDGYSIVCFSDMVDDNSIPVRRGGELEKFKNLLTDHTKPRQIHIQHYLLTDPPEDDYVYSYNNYQELQQEIVNSDKVICCLSGHYHRGVEVFEKAGTFFSIGPAFCAPHRKYRVYQVQAVNLTYRDYSI